MKVLQNQDDFKTRLYREQSTPLVRALAGRRLPRRLVGMRSNGFICGMLMYLVSGEFDVIETIGHRPAFTYGLLCRLLGKKAAVHIGREFYLEDRPRTSIKSAVLECLYRYALTSLDALVVNATGEIEPYARSIGQPAAKVRFIAWPSNIDEPRLIEGRGTYVFAAGSSLRDWTTFFEAVADLGLPCVVVASQNDIKGQKVPENVDLHLDVPYERYRALLEDARIVVVPLLKTQRSTGQSCFLEAMSYGKPVIAARVVGAVDYITEGFNGLYYRPGDCADLKEAISKLMGDEDLRRTLSANGLASVGKTFNSGAYVEALFRMMGQLLESASAGQGRTGAKKTA